MAVLDARVRDRSVSPSRHGGARTRRSSRALPLLALAVLMAGVAGLVTWTVHPRKTGLVTLASRDARSFLASYMAPDGRIVRRDQGGDTVSEGQAYGMLIAVGVGDGQAFGSIWSWTTRHLQRPDGLLAWHWQAGRVLDPMPAADADLDAAFALDLAGSRFGQPRYTATARSMSAAVLREETVTTATGPVLVAGPWARSGVTEPGYFSPQAFAALARLTGDVRWDLLEATSRQIVSRFVLAGRLVPDWVSVSRVSVSGASVNGAATADAIAAPDGSAGVAYGLGSSRLQDWWAASCQRSDRQIIARQWALLMGTATTGRFPIELDLAGHSLSSVTNPAIAASDAGAAAAAGDRSAAVALLGSARRLDDRGPTYFGSAWLALGELVLSTGILGSCPAL